MYFRFNIRNALVDLKIQGINLLEAVKFIHELHTNRIIDVFGKGGEGLEDIAVLVQPVVVFALANDRLSRNGIRLAKYVQLEGIDEAVAGLAYVRNVNGIEFRFLHQFEFLQLIAFSIEPFKFAVIADRRVGANRIGLREDGEIQRVNQAVAVVRTFAILNRIVIQTGCIVPLLGSWPVECTITFGSCLYIVICQLTDAERQNSCTIATRVLNACRDELAACGITQEGNTVPNIRQFASANVDGNVLLDWRSRTRRNYVQREVDD